MLNKEYQNNVHNYDINEQERAFEYKKRVAKLCEIGLNSDDIYAWHGTSIEAIIHLANYGNLPSDSVHGDRFFYAPSRDYSGLPLGVRPQLEAEGYAMSLSAEYYVISQLPFKIKDRAIFNNIFDFDEALEKFINNEVIPNNFNEQLFRQLVREAYEKRKGVVITLSKRITENYKEIGGDTLEDCDQSIITENGLPIQFITGIKPLGQYERSELDKIQKEVS